MTYNPTSEYFLQKFLSQLPSSASKKNSQLFVDYILKCYDEDKDVDWATIAPHLSAYRLRRLQYAERCVSIAYHRFLNTVHFVVEHP